MQIRLIDTPAELTAVEELQRLAWQGNETEIVPVHLLLAAVHAGGLVVGAFEGENLLGFVFGFPGIEDEGGTPGLYHCSHMAAVHPDYRDRNLGYQLKRAQWQIVRRQGADRISWTYDPLQSRNSRLNIAKLGAVCNTYLPNYYGELRDELNFGLPSDRFRVDWWVNSHRVIRKMEDNPPKKLDLAHYLSAEVPRLNQTKLNDAGLVEPLTSTDEPGRLGLFEIPADFREIKDSDPGLALQWRRHTRERFETLFARGYLVTDFIYLAGRHARSFYVLSDGESTF